MDFDKAVELRREKKTYKEIGKVLGISAEAVYQQFRKRYDKGELKELSGYRAARITDPMKQGDHYLRRGARFPVGESIPKQLTPEQKFKVLDLMTKGRHQTLNDLLLEMLLEKL